MSVDPLGVREPDDFDVALAAMTRASRRIDDVDRRTFTNTEPATSARSMLSARQIPAMYEIRLCGTRRGINFVRRSPIRARPLGSPPIMSRRFSRERSRAISPVEQPNRYFLVISLQGRQRRWSLTIPQSVLVRADEAIR